MSPACLEQSGYVRLSERDVYVTLHQPKAAECAAPLLFFPPFGEEYKCAARMMVRLARACAAKGHPVARFDMSGTGESSGSHARANSERWLADAERVLALLKEKYDGDGWIAVGFRLGGILGARLAAAQRADHLVLLEPVVSGAEYLRDLIRRQQIKQMMGGDERTWDPEAVWESGNVVDFGGFEVGAELAAGIRNMSMEAELETLSDECSVSLFRVSAARGFPRGWQKIIQRLENWPAGRAAVIRDRPFWGRAEYYESDVIIDTVLETLRECDRGEEAQ